MSFVAAAVGVVGAVGGAYIASRGAQNAANTQAAAANRATDTQLQMFNTQNEQQAPYRQAGYTALGQIGAQSGDGGYFNHQFTADDLNTNLAPNFEFMRDIGSKGVSNMANAMGGLGGNSLAEISKWNTGFAQNAYQQAFQNYQDQRTSIFNRLASIAGLGQTAASNSATGASTFAGNIAGSQMGAGNALAAGTVGSANAISGGINNAMGWYQLNNLLNRNATVAVPGQVPLISDPTYTPIYNFPGVE